MHIYSYKYIKVNRLQGSDFDGNYISTPQIQVANIPWHYKGKSINYIC